MPQIDIDIETSVRNALVRAIVTEPGATVSDLLALVAGEHASLLRPITLGALADASLGQGGKRPRRPGASPEVSAKAPKKAVNTRTAEGRAAFDRAILVALKDLGGGPASGADVRRKVGGSTLQVRTALNRLIAAGEVTFEGKARGTKYSLAK